MRQPSDYYDSYEGPERESFTGVFIAKTTRALAFKFGIEDGDDEVTWLPLSQLDMDEEVDELVVGQDYTVSIPTWLAEEKELI